MSREERESLGIRDTLVRVSVGIESGEELEEDFRQALDRVAGP
jgi:cystathionine beta-lyase/cystathionine gamma-synthase